MSIGTRSLAGALGVALLRALVAVSAAAPLDDTDEPPVAGQPPNFSGGVGIYKIAMTAEPRALQAEDPLVLTVRISGTGPPGHPPQRPDLRRLPEFTRRFQIADLPDPPHPAASKTWEFRYRLQPRTADVKEIPPLRFDYYKPGVIPREKGFRATYANAIPLTVKPRASVSAAAIEGPAPVVAFPDRFYELAAGPGAVLRQETPFALPGCWGLALILAGPPLACTGWFLAWRRLYPDAARLARRRQSRAARHALQALKRLPVQPPEVLATETAAILAGYLGQRLDWFAAEPTPAEVAVHLQQHGCDVALAAEAAGFFRCCDSVRFAPDPVGSGTDLRVLANKLILDLEGQPWPASHS